MTKAARHIGGVSRLFHRTSTRSGCRDRSSVANEDIADTALDELAGELFGGYHAELPRMPSAKRGEIGCLI
jgi:hypothetical protein